VVWARLSDWKWQADFFPGPYRRAVGDLEHWQYDTFKAGGAIEPVEDAYVSFSLNAKGRD